MFVMAIVASSAVPPIEWLMMLFASQQSVLVSSNNRIGNPLIMKKATVAMQVPITGIQLSGEVA